MPTAGLSLVGFIHDQQDALNHLRTICIPDPKKSDDAHLIADWQAASAKIGGPIPRAGNPRMSPIPINHAHIHALLASPFGPHITMLLSAGATFQMVEVEPLIAWQLVIDEQRSQYHCNGLSKSPRIDELLEVCIPTAQSPDYFGISMNSQSLIVRSRNLNLRLLQAGALPIPNMNVIGAQIGWSLPLVHVVRFNGRYFLHNGYHRALGCALQGATEIPCLVRDVTTPEEIGIRPPGTLPLGILQSPNAPTLGHFTQGRAWNVQLRQMSRIIQVTWSDHVVAEE